MNSLNPNKTYRNKNWLKKKFLDDDLPIKNIAKFCKVSTNCISSWLKRFGLRKRFKGPKQLWSRVKKTSKNKCWLWFSTSKNEHGYGILNYNGRTEKAHRIAYQLFYNCKLTSDQHLLHSCDIPACCNPHHLKIGTQQENMQNAIDRGRNSPPPVHRGENNNKAKLTESKVRIIRKSFKNGVSIINLSKKFNVTRPTINQIVKRETWKHI